MRPQLIARRALSCARHTAAAIRCAGSIISWAADVWFSLTLPLAILALAIAVLVGMAIIAGATPGSLESLTEWHSLLPISHD